ncbi:MAG: bifunctional [glutamate--ammonia ligase]-adenylyl-L-tyrosine phosphorylase/[glutamate--ammonia-ligase] adenylyltransferase, partial [Steroidobacteraceae bacterium]
MPGTDAGRDDLLAAAPAPVRESLDRVCAASDFVSAVCSRQPGVVAELGSSGDLSPEALRSPADYFAARAPRWAGEPPSESDVMAALRQWRRREMVRIAWRDLAGWTTLEETLAELSAFADAAIGAACGHAWRQLAALHGEPRSEDGVAQRLVVVAMGKLGGHELNFSSDVDLVFLYPE